MHPFAVSLRLLKDYKFEVDFGDFGQLITDEPPPLGEGAGPNPARLLAAAVTNCLGASLLFAIRKFKGEIQTLTAEVQGHLERIDGRWRIPEMHVRIQLPEGIESLPHLDRALSQFEDFC
ncbi:MAG: OsmC family peroxiredoxin, partial [Gammaproteobacteria bacterium]